MATPETIERLNAPIAEPLDAFGDEHGLRIEKFANGTQGWELVRRLIA